jgi:hypothetical protein
LLVSILAVVHNLTDGRIGTGRDFYKIQFLLARHLNGFGYGVNTVVALGINNPHLVGADVFINACSVSSDGFALCLVEKISTARLVNIVNLAVKFPLQAGNMKQAGDNIQASG